MGKRMKSTLASTRFKDAPIVAVCAKPTDDENISSNGMLLENWVNVNQRVTLLPPISNFIFVSKSAILITNITLYRS